MERDSKGRFVKKQIQSSTALDLNSSVYIQGIPCCYGMNINLSNYKRITITINNNEYKIDINKLEDLIKSISTFRDAKGRFVKRS